jgi:hypothetical protein
MIELNDVSAPVDDDEEGSAADRAVITKYQSMTGEEIDAELQRQGIDPQPTVTAVIGLVQAKLAELRQALSARAGDPLARADSKPQ